MKYVVVYEIGDFFKSAFVFDSHNEAVDYINSCSNAAGDNIIDLEAINPENYILNLAGGRKGKIKIRSYPDHLVKFDVTNTLNGKHLETRRFSSRNLAIGFANGIANNILRSLHEKGLYGVKVSGGANGGEWLIQDQNKKINSDVLVTVVILKELGGGSDWDILGIKGDASREEVKLAYRKLAKKYHPDKGGDSKKFEEVTKAYENIMAGESKRAAVHIVHEYECINMIYFFADFKKCIKVVSGTTPKSSHAASTKPKVYHDPSEGLGMLVLGIIMVGIGGTLTSISYNSASPGGYYTIFYGLILVGIWDILKGIWWIIAG